MNGRSLAHPLPYPVTSFMSCLKTRVRGHTFPFKTAVRDGYGEPILGSSWRLVRPAGAFPAHLEWQLLGFDCKATRPDSHPPLARKQRLCESQRLKVVDGSDRYFCSSATSTLRAMSRRISARYSGA